MEIKNLSKTIPFKFRLGGWVGSYKEEKWKKVYEKYFVLGYIDARDAMDLLDEVVGVGNWQRDHKEVAGNLYAGVGILIDWNRVWKWDCGTESNTEKEKGESSDSFKRACVNWGIGRFLYTLPNLTITAEEAKSNKFGITEFVKSKYKDKLIERYDSLSTNTNANEKN